MPTKATTAAPAPTHGRGRPRAVDTDGRIIRAPEFARRLEQACDLHPHCPPKGLGRLEWIRQRLAEKGETVSGETVRKWIWGEMAPRAAKAMKLAEILEVDYAWLHFGYDHIATPKERKVRSAVASGAVNVVAGLIQLDGGHPAFPEKEDDVVDLHAIIRGAKYDLHVSLGATEGRTARFVVPAAYEDVTVLGVVREGFAVDIFEISSEVIEKYGTRRGGVIDVAVEGSKLRRIESFTQRF